MIEQASGRSYEDYVRREVLIPAGAERMRLADPFLEGRLENEVKYYHYPRANRSRSLDPKVRKRVPWPYNGFLSTMDAHGGWAASAVDLLRFVVAVDGRGGDDILAEETVELMIERPAYARDVVWYGLGWLVRDIGGGQSNWWHTGSIPGASSLFVRRRQRLLLGGGDELTPEELGEPFACGRRSDVAGIAAGDTVA